jgi:methyl-accepting chemotaxis protein
MGKKQFIRHLEFYGFPDQNKYFSDANCGDLSFIIDKLNELDLEKADKDTLEEFEETVNEEIDSLKDADEVLNGRLSSVESSITTINEDIETLKNADESFNIRLNSAESSITVINDNVEEINENINTIKSEINEINDGIIEITDEISGITINVSELSGNLETFKEYAEETYSKKSDVYTKEEVYNKEEIDEMIPSGQSGYATVEWVEEQGFLTEDSGNTIYVRQDDFSIYSGNVDNSIVELSDSIETIDNKVDSNYNEFSAYTAYAPTIFARKTLEEDVANLITDVLNDEANIQKLSGDTELINENVNTLSAQVMTNKTNISRCADAIRTKANKQDLNDTRIELQGEIDELNDKKADKTDIEVLSGAIDDNTTLITAETANRMSEDRIINNRVDILAEKVQSAESTVRSYDVRITNIENGLEQEITDREQQKLDLIGREDDPSTGNTIWAAKNKADEIFNTAISSAKTYTDAKCDDLYHQFDALSAKTDTELTKFAKKSYVDDRFNEVKRVLRSEIKSGVESAMTYTDDEIAKLDNNIQELDDFVRHPVSGLSVTVDENSTRLAKLTLWDGTGSYDDYTKTPAANGIIDDIWRDLHDLLETLTQKGILP